MQLSNFRRSRSLPALSPWRKTLLTLLLVPVWGQAAFWELSGSVISHDPCLYWENGKYYVFETGTGIGVKSSVDGLVWTQQSAVFAQELPWWRTYAPNMGTNFPWAPAVVRAGDRTYCYYSVSEFGSRNSAIGLVSTSSLGSGVWRDDGLVVSSSGSSAINAIDPSIFRDTTGTLWMTYGSWFGGIRLGQINPVTMKSTGTWTTIASRSGGIEGACMMYAGGWYYLFVSIDLCCQGINSTYKIAVGRSRAVTGPYVDDQGRRMLDGYGRLFDVGNARWHGPGGQSICIQTQGRGSVSRPRFAMARHAYDATNNGAPTLLISDLTIDATGWPRY